MRSIFSNPVCYLVVLVIVIVSYFYGSTQYSESFNSDIAVPILQAHHFDFSSDWYFWGQKRLGSFVPLFSYFLHYLFNIPAITAVSLINHLVLISLFVVYSGFLRKDISKIALALIIFFPCSWSPHLVWIAHPYSVQLLFLGLVIKVLNLSKSIDYGTPNASMRVSLHLALSVFLSFISIWMSEYSLVFLSYIYFDFSKEFLPKFIRFPLLKIGQVGAFIIITAFSCAVVLYLFKKSMGANAQTIDTIFMSLPHFKEALMIYFSHFIDTLLLEHFNPNSIISILFLFWMVYLRKEFVKVSNLFFILLLLAIFPTMALDWVWLNHVNNRYFTPAFFFFGFCLIQASEARVNSLVFRLNQVSEASISLILSPSALVCFLCALQSIPFFLSESRPSTYASLSEFKKLRSCGLIGDYWCSYVIAAVNPDSISATDHRRGVRNPKTIDQVFAKPVIYFVSNNWLKTFPDTAIVHGRWFRRTKDPEFTIQNYTLSEYFLCPDISEFHLTHQNMITRMGHLIRRDNKEYWLSEEDKEGWVWVGPYISLPKGNYDAYFNLTVKPLVGDKMDNLVKLDICTEWGKTVLTELLIQPSDCNKNQFVLSLSLMDIIGDLEFRIYKFNNAIVEVKDIAIRKR